MAKSPAPISTASLKTTPSAARFLKNLSPGAHLPAAGGLSFRDFLEAQLDRLADAMRQHLDITLLKDLIRP